MRKFLLACTLGLICLAMEFPACQKPSRTFPDEEKQRKNPIVPSEAALKAAKHVYAEQCANCHGDTGKGDGSDAMMYDPAPANLCDAAHMNKMTDGEIYYLISEGRKPMPSFKKRLTEEQRWQLVLLVRSFAGAAAKH
jgi:mono/diheme cytochrome c family protein